MPGRGGSVSTKYGLKTLLPPTKNVNPQQLPSYLAKKFHYPPLQVFFNFSYPPMLEGGPLP